MARRPNGRGRLDAGDLAIARTGGGGTAIRCISRYANHFGTRIFMRSYPRDDENEELHSGHPWDRRELPYHRFKGSRRTENNPKQAGRRMAAHKPRRRTTHPQRRNISAGKKIAIKGGISAYNVRAGHIHSTADSRRQ